MSPLLFLWIAWWSQFGTRPPEPPPPVRAKPGGIVLRIPRGEKPHDISPLPACPLPKQ